MGDDMGSGLVVNSRNEASLKARDPALISIQAEGGQITQDQPTIAS